MRIDVFTIFPSLVEGYCSQATVGRAVDTGALDLRVHDVRAAAGDPRRSVDDAPFGGGPGMVLMCEPVFKAFERAQDDGPIPRPVLLLACGSRPFDQSRAAELASLEGFSLVCGRYEGVDQRIADHLCDGELSIADVVLAGGEAAALVVIEAVSRLLPGVLGNAESPRQDSFQGGLLEHPQYTRPAEFRGWMVPQVLVSGDHGAVRRWRHLRALRRTLELRPEMVEARGLSEDEVSALGAEDAASERGYDD
ncbi:MAG: tRNA (guanosine(37)-N1)-methyltransferase TrmD [Acidimicrobiales bacterium]